MAKRKRTNNDLQNIHKVNAINVAKKDWLKEENFRVPWLLSSFYFWMIYFSPLILKLTFKFFKSCSSYDNVYNKIFIGVCLYVLYCCFLTQPTEMNK
jgi:hypothetical protein